MRPIGTGRRRHFRARPIHGYKRERIERTYGRLVTGADDGFRSRLDSYGKLAEVIDSGRPQ